MSKVTFVKKAPAARERRGMGQLCIRFGGPDQNFQQKTLHVNEIRMGCQAGRSRAPGPPALAGKTECPRHLAHSKILPSGRASRRVDTECQFGLRSAHGMGYPLRLATGASKSGGSVGHVEDHFHADVGAIRSLNHGNA